MNVLLSIKPVHVANILAGRKTFEFRRKMFARDVRTVLIYSTMPVGRIVAEFDIADILYDEPERLWKRTKYGSGISKQYFDKYFQGTEQAFAIEIGEIREYVEQVDPFNIIDNFSPPQSYRYMHDWPKIGSLRQLNFFS
jgi:predicted transcriptional regulator